METFKIISWLRDKVARAEDLSWQRMLKVAADRLEELVRKTGDDSHGRWIRRHNETKCSECQFIYYSHHADYNYCPNCGKKMWR